MTTPAVMTYDSLTEDIKEYAERTDDPFLTQVPRFIMMAENRIASEVRGLGHLKIVESRVHVGNPSVKKPSRWRETGSVNITVGTKRLEVYNRSYEYCRKFEPDSAVRGVPRFYADYGYEHFFFAPAPDQEYAFELLFFERPDPLSTQNQTNWTTQYAPQLLLYASLLEAQAFLKSDERIQIFKGFYDTAVAGVGGEAARRMFDRAAIRKE